MTHFFSLPKYASLPCITRGITRGCLGSLIVLSLLFLNACSQKSPTVLKSMTDKGAGAKPQDQIKKSDKVALLIPLSGQHEALGHSLEKAAEMSLFDHANDAINIAMYDTKSSETGAAQAAQKAIQEGAGIIIGPVFSNNVQAVSQISRRAHINVVSFSNNKDIANGGVFVLGFSPEEQIRQVVSYAASRGKKAFGVLIPRNGYGALVEREVQHLKKQYQFDVEFITYDVNSNNLSHELNPLKTLKVDTLFIPEGGRSLARVISAALYQEIPLEGIQLLGTGQWDDPKIFANHTLSGAWIAAPDPQERFSFNGKYKQAYSEEPNRLATLSYDAISMLAVLRRHHGEQAFNVAALTQSRGFDGVDGVFRLQQNGVSERKLAILEVTQQGLRVLQTTDKSF
ncbi:MAG TPA: hypothetical protein DD412_07360 [Holosporales bacterium]|nr:hypothetical protein [Holosporales bacterium]